ncbi:hypothetical protein ACVWXN_006814 [Bradyrhizobium sp. i1.4.4]
MSTTSGFNCISEEAGDRHWAYPARDRGERPGYGARAIEIHVTDQYVSSPIFDAIDPYIYYDSAGLNPVTTDQLGLSRSSYKNIGATTHQRKIFGLRVCDRDSAILLKQKLRKRFSDDVGTPNDDGIESSEFGPNALD